MRTRTTFPHAGAPQGGNTVKRPVSQCVTIFCLVPLLLMAEGVSLEEQVAAAKADIAVAQQVNIELKAQLAAKETEASALKVKLKQIDDQINALKKEQHLESK